MKNSHKPSPEKWNWQRYSQINKYSEYLLPADIPYKKYLISPSGWKEIDTRYTDTKSNPQEEMRTTETIKYLWVNIKDNACIYSLNFSKTHKTIIKAINIILYCGLYNIYINILLELS